MSLRRFVLLRGSRVRVYSPTPNENADGSPAKPTWTLEKSDVPILFEPITAELAAKVFGAPESIRERGFTSQLEGIRAGWGLVVDSGRNSGSALRVEEVLAYDYQSRNAHEELGVVVATEAIP